MVYTHGTLIDHRAFSPLVNKLCSKYNIETIRADGAYDKEPCFCECYNQNIEPIIPPFTKAIIKKDIIFKDRNNAIIDIKSHSNYVTGLAEWKKKKGYGKRSLVVTYFSRFKYIFGFSLKSTHEESRRNELIIKNNILNNFTRLGMPMPMFELVQ